jgi:acetolactate synthase-1/2/3 large subunit
MIKVSDLIAQLLVQCGIEHVFMVTGGHSMHLNDSIGREGRLQYICNHHEQASAIAAEGYFRARGKMCAVIVTSGPGGTNTITGIIGQWLDSIPCIYISGQVKLETSTTTYPDAGLRQLGDQEINILDIVRPVTKYAAMVRNPLKIKYYIEKAINISRNGRPGPVWIDVPLDIQSSVINRSSLILYNPKDDEICFNADELTNQAHDTIEKMKQAERPVILAGHGIRLSGGINYFVELIEKLNIPVLTSICGHDLLWSDHPLYFGRPGICGDRHGNFIIQNCDLVLVVGARLGIRQISYNYSAFAREAFRIMVDIDKAELDKPTLDINMKIHSDAKLFLNCMLNAIGDEKLEKKDKWISWCGKVRTNLPSILEDNPINQEFVNSYSFADVLFKLLNKDDLVVTGNGTAYTSTFQIMHINKGVRVFANQGCASMGYDIPAAIGACIASNKNPVILITGDGSIQMNIQELQTVVYCQLPIKIFVLNNNGYLAQRKTQDSYFKGFYVGSESGSGVSCPDICRIADAYGIKSFKIKDEKDMDEIISRILKMQEAVLCEVYINPKQSLFPKLSSSVGRDGQMRSRPLEDMYPFVPRDKFNKNMIVKPIDDD